MTDPAILPGIIDALQAATNVLNASGASQEHILQLCRGLMNNAQPVETFAATSIEDEVQAADYTKVNFRLHDSDYLYKLEHSDGHGNTDHTQLSQWAGQSSTGALPLCISCLLINLALQILQRRRWFDRHMYYGKTPSTNPDSLLTR